jgi:PTH1 family peptidyl-tRNA hydrolase
MSIFDLFKKIESEDNGNVKGKTEYIIAGLGNPGLEYAKTRHNTGFMTLDRFAEKNNIRINKMQFKADCADIMINQKRCLLMKPATYMNNSGEAVEQARAFYKIPYENVIVVYDDISLAPGKLRIRRKGSAGGHNGIKSIIACMGDENFPRIKMGVGEKPHKDYNLADWVLGKYTDEQMNLVNEAIEKACEAIPLIVAGKIDEAMNKFSK